MKQKKIKAFFAVAAIAAVGLGSYKAYGSYTAANMSEEDLFIAENIEALSQMLEAGPGEICVRIGGGSCYVRKFGPKDYIPGTEGEWIQNWWYEPSGEWEEVKYRKPYAPWEKGNCKGYPNYCPEGLKTEPAGDGANGTIYGCDN